jgi:hypothetical protein
MWVCRPTQSPSFLPPTVGRRTSPVAAGKIEAAGGNELPQSPDAVAANVRSDSHRARLPVSGVSNPTRRKVRPPARIVSPSTTSIAPGSIGLPSAGVVAIATTAMRARMRAPCRSSWIIRSPILVFWPRPRLGTSAPTGLSHRSPWGRDGVHARYCSICRGRAPGTGLSHQGTAAYR